MAKKMVWNQEQGKMVEAGTEKASKDVERIALDSEQVATLKSYAKIDGFDLTGISYVTEKDAKGKTKTDNAGKPIYKMVDGKKETVTVEESTGKVNAAVASYVSIAVNMLIAHRIEAEALTEAIAEAEVLAAPAKETTD